MKALKFIAPLLFLFSSCSILAPSSEQPTLEETHWRLVAMNQKPIEPSEQAFIEFKGTKASGRAACNNFSTETEVKKNKLSFANIISTKMFCDGLMDQENQIVTNLQKVTRYEIRYGLLYLYDSNTLLLTYKK
jgi:heat shock protein HslJ